MKSLRQSTKKLGKGFPCSFPADLQICPKSLLNLVQVVWLPKPDVTTWVEEHFRDICSEDLLTEFQGMAHAENRVWFISATSKLLKTDWISDDFLSVKAEFTIDNFGKSFEGYNHFGGIDYYDDVLFVPLEGEHPHPPRLVAFSKNLDFIGWAKISRLDDPEQSASSCCIHPWNRYLYVSQDDNIQVYNPFGFFTRLPQRSQWGKPVNAPLLSEYLLYDQLGNPVKGGFQGIVFSPHGRLYATRARKRRSPGWDNSIECYDAMTGIRTSQKEFDYTGPGDEIQGLDIYPEDTIVVSVLINNPESVLVRLFNYTDPGIRVPF